MDVTPTGKLASRESTADGLLTAPVTNSNDLLPAIRPRTPSAAANTPGARKRRRPPSNAGLPDGDRGYAVSFMCARPQTRLSSIGGIDATLQTIRELAEWPLFHSEIYAHLGVDTPRGILLHGPPGCGKTLLAHAIAGDLGVSFLKVSGPEIVSSMSGESERRLRNLFAEARKKAPSIVFIDEIDAIASRKEGATKDMERRIVSQLISCIDEGVVLEEDKRVEEKQGEPPVAVFDSATEKEDGNAKAEKNAPETKAESGAETASFIVIAATNRPEVIEPALRRAGRFDREIELGAPDEAGRAAILSKLGRKLKVTDDVDMAVLAKQTAGYVGADLDLLVREAGMVAVRRFANDVQEKIAAEQTGSAMQLDAGDAAQEPEQEVLLRGQLPRERFSSDALQPYAVSMADFKSALETIQPSALREGFASRPDVTWADVGALEHVRDDLMMAIVQPIRRPEVFAALGLHAPAGVLLYGPPGCGKTLLARAVASESGANFISVKGPELLSKYVGDSELAVRKLFARARSSAPCVIFFDELDALAPRRGNEGSASSSGASERVVNMLLTEMDGFGSRQQVFLVAATNRPDIIDPAMLRPGRLDKLLYVGLPSEEGRVSILQKQAAKMKIEAGVDLAKVARDPRCAGFSGADLNALVRGAGERALREQLMDSAVEGIGGIQQRHFDVALEAVLPSVSARDARLYQSMETKLRKSRAQLVAKEEQVPKK